MDGITIARDLQSGMNRRYSRDKRERRQRMEPINWAPVGVVLTIVTGVAALATADFQTVLVTVMAFSAGVAVGRHPLHQSSDRSGAGGARE